jgi:hypothetical protein
MQMIARSVSTLAAVAALQLFALLAPSQAKPAMTYGPFAPDVSIGKAVAAQPDMAWRLVRHRRTGAVVGAVAGRPLEFAGREWWLSLGDSSGIDPLPYVYSFDLTSDVESEDAGACLDRLSALISGLEGTYGAFGQHPAFAHEAIDASPALYGGLTPFKIRPAGHASVVRDYGDGHYTSFVEVDEDKGEAVLVEAWFLSGARPCSLRLKAFQDNDRIRRAKVSRERHENRSR